MYTYGGEIQKGGYSKVLQAFKDNKKYAVKCLTFQLNNEDIVGAAWLKEADFLARCDHESILKPAGIFYGSPFIDPLPIRFGKFDQIHVVSLLAFKDLYGYIREYSKELVASHLKRMMLQIAQGIEYLHHMDACHRDIKSSNVLLYTDEVYDHLRNAKLCDFGMCKVITSDHINSGHVSTGCYKPPELIMGNGYYDKSIDMWSLGTLFFEMFNIKYAYGNVIPKAKQMSDINVVRQIFEHRGSPSLELFNYLSDKGTPLIPFKILKDLKRKPIKSLFDEKQQVLLNFEKQIDSVKNFGTLNQYCDLLENLIEPDPRTRFTIRQVLDHPFFSEVPTVYKNGEKEIWMGLKKQMLTPRVFHILTKIKNDELRLAGIDVIGSIPTDIAKSSSFHFSMWRIVFLGIDIYDRCLLHFYPDKEEIVKEVIVKEELVKEEIVKEEIVKEEIVKDEKEIDNPEVEKITKLPTSKLLGLCCGYIACKYFMDEATPKLRDLFPQHKIEDPNMLMSLEKKILNDVLQWKIYRPNIYDLMQKKISPVTLFDLMRRDIFYSGQHTIDKISVIFQDEASSN